MKKNLLIVAALFASMAASAQTIWTCEGTDDTDVTGLKGSTSETNLTVSDVKCGAGLIIKGMQAQYKDKDGNKYNYCTDATKSLYKFVPTNEQITDPDPEAAGKLTTDVPYRSIEGAETNDMIVRFNFAIEEGNLTDYLKIAGFKFDMARCGTDAVRMNVRLVGEGDEGEYNSGWLINADNWSSVSGGIGNWTPNNEEGYDGGCTPAREDGGKADSSPTDGCTHFNIPAPADLPSTLYDATLEIAIYNISNNKSAVLHNVTILHSSDGSGISIITTEKEDANAPVYNLAGQRVSKDAKGILIQNGKKFINNK